MTFLELVNETLDDSGNADEGDLSTLTPTTLEAPLTATQRRAVRFVRNALQIVETQRTWPFLRQDFRIRLEAGEEPKTRYTPAEIAALAGPGAPAVWKWRTENGWYINETQTAEGQRVDGTAIPELTWGNFRYAYGVRDALPRSRPVAFAISPQRDVVIAPAPGVGREIDLQGEYDRNPTRLSADADEPAFPEAYHPIVKWRAVMLMAGYDENEKLYVTAQATYTDLYSNMGISEGFEDFENPLTLA